MPLYEAKYEKQGNVHDFKVNIVSFHFVAVTRDNKGKYTWPRTVAGHLVELPCAVQGEDSQAAHTCAHDGHWDQLFTDNCPFASETTRILEQFSKVSP